MQVHASLDAERLVSAKVTQLQYRVDQLQDHLGRYAKDVDPGQMAEKHKKTASALWDARESYFTPLVDLHDGASSADDVRKKRDELQVRLVEIYETTPRTSDAAYKDAGEGLKAREELTFSGAEIDALLPKTLRRAS